MIKSLRTEKVLRRNWVLSAIPSRFITSTERRSLKRTVFKGFVNISAKFNFEGTYLKEILSLLDKTSPQNLILISMCFVRFAWVGLLSKICAAGSLSTINSVAQRMSAKPRSKSRGCSHKISFVASAIWTISDSVLDTSWADQESGLFPRKITYPPCFFCHLCHSQNLRPKKLPRTGYFLRAPPE